jgi:hypothetical protein
MNEFADFLFSLVLLGARPVITIALGLAVVGTLLNIHDLRVARQRRMTECPHRWIYASAWDQGRFWHRICRDCPRQEVVALEDVPEKWRQREFVARASSPRAVRQWRTSLIRWTRLRGRAANRTPGR